MIDNLKIYFRRNWIIIVFIVLIVFLMLSMPYQSPLEDYEPFIFILNFVWCCWPFNYEIAGKPFKQKQPNPPLMLRFMKTFSYFPLIFGLFISLWAYLFTPLLAYWEMKNTMAMVGITDVEFDWKFSLYRLLLIAIATIPVIVFIRWFNRKLEIRYRHNINKQNLCFACGYNLTGAVSPTCPECGHPIPGRQHNPDS